MRLIIMSLLTLATTSSIAQLSYKDIISRSITFYQARPSDAVKLSIRRFDDLDTSENKSIVVYDRNTKIAAEIYETTSRHYMRTRDSSFSIDPAKQQFTAFRGGTESWYWNLPGMQTERYFGDFSKKLEKANSVSVDSTDTSYTITLITKGKKSQAIFNKDFSILETRSSSDETGRLSTMVYTYQPKAIPQEFSDLSNLVARNLSTYKRNTVIHEPDGFYNKRVDSLKGLIVDREALVTIMGQPIASDKYILLDFFFQACSPCREAIPSLNKIVSEKQQIQVIGIDKQPADSARMPAFVQKHKIEYPIVMGANALGVHKFFWGDMVTFGYPTTLLIAPDGKVLLANVGYGSDFERKIKKAVRL